MDDDRRQGSYGRFFAMIATATVAMFLLMYLNSHRILDHAWFSETRLYMTLIMAGAMMIVMLGFMLDMYGLDMYGNRTNAAEAGARAVPDFSAEPE